MIIRIKKKRNWSPYVPQKPWKYHQPHPLRNPQQHPNSSVVRDHSLNEFQLQEYGLGKSIHIFKLFAKQQQTCFNYKPQHVTISISKIFRILFIITYNTKYTIAY